MPDNDDSVEQLKEWISLSFKFSPSRLRTGDDTPQVFSKDHVFLTDDVETFARAFTPKRIEEIGLIYQSESGCVGDMSMKEKRRRHDPIAEAAILEVYRQNPNRTNGAVHRILDLRGKTDQQGQPISESNVRRVLKEHRPECKK